MKFRKRKHVSMRNVSVEFEQNKSIADWLSNELDQQFNSYLRKKSEQDLRAWMYKKAKEQAENSPSSQHIFFARVKI